MPNLTEYGWELHWDIHTFAEDDVKEIAAALNTETGTTIVLRQRARHAALVDTFIVLAVSVLGVSLLKKFAEKVGEKLGEEIGNDLVKVYSKIKTLLIAKLQKNRSPQGFQCLYEITLGEIVIRAVVRGSQDEEMLIDASVNSLPELLSVVRSVLSELQIDEEIVEIRIVFDNSVREWKPLFLSTKENIYAIEEA